MQVVGALGCGTAGLLEQLGSRPFANAGHTPLSLWWPRVAAHWCLA